jgi:hypothetical protein
MICLSQRARHSLRLREMSPLDHLAEGISLEQVRKLLVGWKADAANAIISTDHLHLFNTWDFTPPPESHSKPQRMIFDNGRLITWGDPASVGPAQKVIDPHKSAI